MDKNESTQKLIEHLNSVINYEVEKPYTEMDADLVEACVELALELQGKNYTLSNEEIEEKVSKIPFADTNDVISVPQRKKKITKRKILLIAAIIAILCTLLTIISSGRFVEYWHSIMNEKFGAVFSAPIGEKFTEENVEAGYLGKPEYYTDIDDFYANEQYDVLLPDKLPEEIDLIGIQIVEGDKCIFAFFNSIITSYEIKLNTPLPQKIAQNINKTVLSNNISCYIDRFEDINSVQIYFEHNGNFYSIGGTDEQILLNIIENLEDLQ